MNVVDKLEKSDITGYTGVGLGNFDGLHIGHMALLNTLIYESRMLDISPAVFTFTKHPGHILRKDLYQPLITSLNHKTQILSHMDLDWLILQEFDEDFSEITARDFVQTILVEKLHAELIVVGFNYRFGFMGEGNIHDLHKLGSEFGFKVVVVPPVAIEQEIVSSTLIRSYILEGNMERVFQLLGRYFSIPGQVSNGRRIGREIGFPTANLYPDPDMAIPDFGVYITRTLVANKWYNSITNIGLAPTIREDGSLSIETHLLAYQGDLYGQYIEVSFIKQLRGEKKFASKEELVKQIKVDVDEAKQYFILNI